MIKVKHSLQYSDNDSELVYKTKNRDFYLNIPKEGIIDKTNMNEYDYIKVKKITFGQINWQFSVFGKDIETLT